MAALTPSKIDEIQVGGKTQFTFIFSSATAADTFDMGSYLNGRKIVDISGENVSDAASLAYTYTAAGVITVPAGPSTDIISIVVDVMVVS